MLRTRSVTDGHSPEGAALKDLMGLVDVGRNGVDPEKEKSARSKQRPDLLEISVNVERGPMLKYLNGDQVVKCPSALECPKIGGYKTRANWAS